MKTKKRFFIAGFIAIFSITLMISSSSAKSVRGVTENTIKVGGIWDLTGPVATFERPIVNGIKNYTKYVNDQGGINGRKIKFILEDSRYTIPASVAAFKKLLHKDEILALLGPGSTGETKVLMGKIMGQKLPTFPLAADRDLIDPTRRYLFLALDTYDNMVGIIMDYIVEQTKTKKPKIAVLCGDAGFKFQFLRAVKKWSKHFNLDVPVLMTAVAVFDLTSEILTLKKTKADYLIAIHATPVIASLLKQSQMFGFHPKVFVTYHATTEDIIKMAGKAADNYHGVHFYSSWYDDTPGMAKLRKITLQYHPGTEKPYRSKNYCLGWVYATLLYEGAKRAGKDLDGEKIVDALETLKDFDTGGIGGLITYTSKDHAGIKYEKVYKGDPLTGKLIPITDWRLPPSSK